MNARRPEGFFLFIPVQQLYNKADSPLRPPLGGTRESQLFCLYFTSTPCNTGRKMLENVNLSQLCPTREWDKLLWQNYRYPREVKGCTAVLKLELYPTKRIYILDNSLVSGQPPKPVWDSCCRDQQGFLTLFKPAPRISQLI